MSSVVIPNELSTITYVVRHHVAEVTLNRPEVHNAFNERMQDELAALWRHIRLDEGVRVVVLIDASQALSDIITSQRPTRVQATLRNMWAGRSLSPEQALGLGNVFLQLG